MEKYSFIEILTQRIEVKDETYKFQGIQIPIIQRDYAQGRKKESVIRNRFLKSIFNSLKDNKDLELDFVYGAKKNIDSTDLFIPLDGQQRLTTLYLLNWYIGNRELDGQELDDLRNTLAKFTYATRFSSNIFCEKLSLKSIGFNKNPSVEIMDSYWFFDTFKLDPTVQSMLVMLDAIHMEYEKLNIKLFKNINKIKFYFLSLDGFDLTDELYIKMNARGKQLTHFENFKADLFKWIQDEENPFRSSFIEKCNYNGLEVNYHLNFELRLDNEWTGLFWNHSKKNSKNEEKLVDPYMMQFFNRYLLNSYIISSDLSQSELENNSDFKNIYGNQGDDTKIEYSDFGFYTKALTMVSENENKIHNIEKILNSLTEHWSDINQVIAPNWNKPDNWNIFSKTINQRQRIIFYATTTYLEKFSFNKETFSDWIRVVWNIIIDPNIRSVPAMIGALRFVNELSLHSNNILDYLKNPDSILFYNSATFYTQLKEEHQKAILIKQSVDWKNEIIDAESHKLFQGNIKFLLDEQAINNLEYFKKFKETAFEIFEDNDLTDKANNYLWIRALLSKSSEIVLPITLSNGNFSHWRYLINGAFIKSMQSLIKQIMNSEESAKTSMMNMCNNYSLDLSKKWLFPLINWVGNNGETLLGNYSETRKIMAYNNYGNTPNHIYLYNKTVWTESNIILSSNRNKVISELLKTSTSIRNNHQWSNIQKSFFKGWNIRFERNVSDLPFAYIFDISHLTVGIKHTPELELEFSNFEISEKNRANGWLLKSRFQYNELKEDEINTFLNEIEKKIFDKSSINSLISKLKYKNL